MDNDGRSRSDISCSDNGASCSRSDTGRSHNVGIVNGNVSSSSDDGSGTSRRTVAEVLVVSAAVVSEMVLVVLVFGVVRAPLLCARAVIDTFGEVLTIDMRVDVLTIMSDATVNLLMDALADIILRILTNSDVGVLVDVNINVFAGVMTAFEFVMPAPLE